MKLVVIVAAMGAAIAQTLPAPAPITVWAAVSLTNALPSVAAAYRAVGSGGVRFKFGASNLLAQRIINGERVDVFISADEAQMDAVERAGRLVAGSRIDLLGNQLAVVVPSNRRRRLVSIRDLTDPAIKRIAIGDPTGVPAGVYAKAYLERIGLWSTLQAKMVPTPSVREALAAVESHAADAGIVYRTDVRIASRASVAWVVPVAQEPRIVYPAAIVAGAPEQAAASRFLTFMRGVTAWRVFERFGFSKPRAP